MPVAPIKWARNTADNCGEKTSDESVARKTRFEATPKGGLLGLEVHSHHVTVLFMISP